MHIYGVNPTVETNAQLAEAKREAAAFRKKLEEAAAGLPASEDCIVSINAQQEKDEGKSKQENHQKQEQKQENDQEKDIDSHISDWA
jgi:small-conductance mechanosensitive channel